MKVCLDVDYRAEGAVAAAVTFEAWRDREARSEHVALIERVEDYEPGAFYRRELPCLLAVLAKLPDEPEIVVVDGYAWLGDRPGLGAHLHRAVGWPVIGVAKTAFAGAQAEAVFRGRSRRPLFVTSAGLDVSAAAEAIAAMHGAGRLPTLLRRVDRLCRTAERP